jgi:short subunit dehydrogenase-like uncharacterized protein
MRIMPTKPFDVVVFGATSFVGQILCSYLFEQFGLDGPVKWAAAGRSRSKLEKLRASLGKKAARLELLEANADDSRALLELCRKGRVIVSTVGPYALYGEPLVRACAESGTDYCDLAGEVQWMRRMIEQYEAKAAATGARIVHSCGFDSIPFDLGVHHLQAVARKRFGAPCPEVKMRVRSIRGSFSGGTAASIMNVVKEVAANPALRKELADPYSLCPSGYTPKVRQPVVAFAAYDRDFSGWIAPFVMSAVNTRLVHRTNALSKQSYGAGFKYDEAMLTGRGLRGRLTAAGTSAALGGFMIAAAIAPLRNGLQRFVLPAPGAGPSPEAQRKGGYDLRFLGRAKDGRTLRTRVTGDRDPGYGSTAKILGQAAACLALDVRPTVPGGFWTTATIFGDRLIERLQNDAGLTFETLD